MPRRTSLLLTLCFACSLTSLFAQQNAPALVIDPLEDATTEVLESIEKGDRTGQFNLGNLYTAIFSIKALKPVFTKPCTTTNCRHPKSALCPWQHLLQRAGPSEKQPHGL
ncbi:MAG: hypothetical protein JW739_05835 [Opitutales bacterium]|nr:hypothetical protein [Opitutales bacterium]